ncbi:MAG: SBBP repeat-containing protein [bacterium]|nr:SBBP repeat-containing protein [bacterium]
MKKAFSLFVCLVLIFLVDAQSPKFEWAKHIGSNADSVTYANSIKTDKYGNTYTFGIFSGTVDFDPGVGETFLSVSGFRYTRDIFLLKTAHNGEFLWVKQMGGNEDDYGNSITLDADGNIYLTGVFNGKSDFDPSTGIFNLTSNGPDDIFISKLDPSGNFIWAKSIGGITSDWSNSISVDNSSNIFLTGFFNSTVDFDPNGGIYELTAKGSDIFILKLNNNGNFLWAKQFSGMGDNESGASIATDMAGNVYTTGRFNMTTDFDPDVNAIFNQTSNGEEDIFVSKLDSNGEFIWAKSFGGIGMDNGNTISVDDFGNIYIAGSFNETVDFNPSLGTFSIKAFGDNNSADIFILKLNSSGNFKWVKRMGSIFQDEALAMTLDKNGNVFTTGVFQDTADFDPGTNIYNLIASGTNFDIFISKLDSTGKFQWAKKMGGNLSDVGLSIALDNMDNIYSCGYFSGTADFDDKNSYKMTSYGKTDMYFHKFSKQTLPITENSIQNYVTIFPNPSNGKLSIYINPLKGEVEIDLYNATGNLIYKTTNANAKSILDLSHLPNGLYIIKISTSDHQYSTQKIIKQ